MAIRIKIKVTTNANQDKICGYLGGETLKIKIKAKPIGGKANTNLIKFLSKELDIPQKDLSIIVGRTSRLKIIDIYNIEEKEFLEKLSI